MGFVPQFPTIEARYSWTVVLHCHRRDLATTARLGSIAKCWVKPMLALAQRNISIDTLDAAKLSGRVNKTFDLHKSPLIESTYIDIELL